MADSDADSRPIGDKKAQKRLQQIGSILRKCASLQSVSHHSLSPINQIKQTPVIQVTPETSLFDQNVNIVVQGLLKNVKVTLHAAVETLWQGKPVQFVSCSHYVTDGAGQVNLMTEASLGGTYTGVEPMGLFWSMEPNPSLPQNIRMVQKDVEKMLHYRLSVYLDHLSLSDLHTQGSQPQPVTVTTIQRLVKAPEVRRLPVREGNIRGTLFLPPGKGPFPGVIDMFGMAGGLMEARGAMLASHGFAALSLAIFNYQDLPIGVEGIKFDYFVETVEWFSSLPPVKDGGIGVVAVSGGAIFSMLMGWKLPQVVAIVPINSPIFYAFCDLYYRNQFFRKGVICNWEGCQTEEGLICKNAWMYTREDVIPLWESSTQVMVLMSDDDEQVSPELADELYNMYPEDKRHLIEVVHYPGAGHLLEPPYTPHCRSCFNPPFGLDLLWGGRKLEHAKAQEDSWKRIINFLTKHLP